MTLSCCRQMKPIVLKYLNLYRLYMRLPVVLSPFDLFNVGVDLVTSQSGLRQTGCECEWDIRISLQRIDCYFNLMPRKGDVAKERYDAFIARYDGLEDCQLCAVPAVVWIKLEMVGCYSTLATIMHFQPQYQPDGGAHSTQRYIKTKQACVFLQAMWRMLEIFYLNNRVRHLLRVALRSWRNYFRHRIIIATCVPPIAHNLFHAQTQITSTF